MGLPRFESFSDVVRYIAANWPTYVPEFRIFLIVVLVASLADMGSTICVMQMSGPESELHPVIRCMSEQLGPVLGPVCGKAWQFLGVVVLTLLLRPRARFIFVPAAIYYAGAAFYNLWVSGLLFP